MTGHGGSNDERTAALLLEDSVNFAQISLANFTKAGTGETKRTFRPHGHRRTVKEKSKLQKLHHIIELGKNEDIPHHRS